MSEAPERIFCKESHDSWGQCRHWYRDAAGGGHEYTRTDLAEAATREAVRKALEEAARIADDGVKEGARKLSEWQLNLRGRPSIRYRIARADIDARQSVRDKIRALIRDDATAALAARDRRMKAEGMRRAARVVMDSSAYVPLPLAGTGDLSLQIKYSVAEILTAASEMEQADGKGG